MTKNISTSNDSDLFLRLQEGDEKAFETIFLTYYPSLVVYAGRFIGDEESKEVVQDLMVWIWENRTMHIISTTFRNYLFTAVKRKCLSLLERNEFKYKIHQVLFEQNKLLFDDPEFYIIEELTKNIEAALERLPGTYREAFELNRFEKMTYKEIAERLQVSPKTVDYRIQQALKQLRKDLKEYLPLLIL